MSHRMKTQCRLLRPFHLAAPASVVLMIVAVVSGCDRAPSSQVVPESNTLSSEHLLVQQPEDPKSLTQAAEDLSVSQPAAAPQEMVLIGKIDAGDFPAFQDGQATFMLSELPADGHGLNDPDHEDNCPFCKRRAEKAPKAIVNLVDSDGKTLENDARKLLGVAQGDRIIAVGTGTYDKAVNAITLQCTGVYVGQ